MAGNVVSIRGRPKGDKRISRGGQRSKAARTVELQSCLSLAHKAEVELEVLVLGMYVMCCKDDVVSGGCGAC